VSGIYFLNTKMLPLVVENTPNFEEGYIRKGNVIIKRIKLSYKLAYQMGLPDKPRMCGKIVGIGQRPEGENK
jgi:hypothetical protein